jgi:hypothetical protein
VENDRNTTISYEVRSPWAEADPIPLRGISPRPADLAALKIGLFASSKPAAPRIMAALEEQMRARYPNVRTSRYNAEEGFILLQMAGRSRERFIEWVKGVDAIVASVGD